MKTFKLSIKYKLILLITSITIVSSLICLQVINMYVQKKNQINLQNESQVLAKLMGEFVVPAIAFHDKTGAYEIISRTKLLEKVNSIIIIDTSGIIFSEHHRNPFEKSDLNKKINVAGIDTSYIVENCLTVESRIFYSGIFYGFIIMKSEYDEFNIFKNELNLSLLIIVSIVLVISVILSTSFQKIISKPIVDLTSIALNVLETDNYNVKLNEEQTDEFGLLNRTFNAMFGKISKQNIERDEAARIIRENEMRYRVLFNYSPIPIFLFDDEFCTMSNYASFNLLRTSDERDIVGKSYKEIFTTDNPNNYAHIFSHNMFNQRRLSSNFSIVDMNNNIRNVELSSMLISKENVHTNIIMCIDISDKIEFEMKMLKMNEESELKVLHRTAILEETLSKINEQNTLLNIKEKELSAAKDEAEKANKIKSEFIANISHEIRTPMNVIKGYSEILYKKLEEPENIKILKTIVYSSETLLSIINDILDVSKIEAGKLQIFPTLIDLHRTLGEINNMFSSKCEEQQVNLYFDIEKDLPSQVVIDGLRFNQIFFNLLSNSIKFTDSGYIRVKCRHIPIDTEHVDLLFEVQDTGIGIKREHLGIIFDAFAQERLQSRTSQLGTGLGLTITKKLVECMNGTINVESTLDIGTTFFVEFKNVEIKIQSKNNVDFSADSFNFDGSIKALIIDDYELNRIVLKNKLDEAGIYSYEASDLEGALELVSLNKFDIIFVDLIIPEIDGVEIARQLKSYEYFNNCPLIAYSASHNYVHDDDEHLFDDFLNKPIKSRALFEIIKKHINQKLEEKNLTLENVVLDDKMETEIDQKLLAELIDLIEHEWEKFAVILSERVIIDDIQDFVELLKTKVDTYNIQIFTQYVISLDSAVSDFEIKHFKYLLKRVCTNSEASWSCCLDSLIWHCYFEHDLNHFIIDNPSVLIRILKKYVLFGIVQVK